MEKDATRILVVCKPTRREPCGGGGRRKINSTIAASFLLAAAFEEEDKICVSFFLHFSLPLFRSAQPSDFSDLKCLIIKLHE